MIYSQNKNKVQLRSAMDGVNMKRCNLRMRARLKFITFCMSVILPPWVAKLETQGALLKSLPSCSPAYCVQNTR